MLTPPKAEAVGLNMVWNVITLQAPHLVIVGIYRKKPQALHSKNNGEQSLVFEELVVLLCQIELLLNSRPRCQTLEDSYDTELLIRAHLCLGGKIETLPLIESNDNNTTNTSSIKKWSQIQSLFSNLWKRWS